MVLVVLNVGGAKRVKLVVPELERGRQAPLNSQVVCVDDVRLGRIGLVVSIHFHNQRRTHPKRSRAPGLVANLVGAHVLKQKGHSLGAQVVAAKINSTVL